MCVQCINFTFPDELRIKLRNKAQRTVGYYAEMSFLVDVSVQAFKLCNIHPTKNSDSC